MLAFILLAFLVTFISTAALPVSDLDSPAANHGLLLVTPPSLSSTSTANSSRLGTAYPPGYPRHAYDYHVPYSSLTLHCFRFEAGPRQDAEDLDELFAKVISIYGDPKRRDDTVWSTTSHGEISWHDGDERTGQSWLVLGLPNIGTRRASNLTYGEFVEAMVGFNQVRREYPTLEIFTEIQREGAFDGLALMWFYTEAPNHELDISDGSVGNAKYSKTKESGIEMAKD